MEVINNEAIYQGKKFKNSFAFLSSSGFEEAQ
jgi:hypothetical protein